MDLRTRLVGIRSQLCHAQDTYHYIRAFTEHT